MIGSEDLCDYQDFVVMKGEEKTSLRLLLSYVQEAYGLPLYMHSLPAFSPLFQLLREGRESNASARGKTERQDGFSIAYRKSLQDTTPVIHLPSSFEEYLASLRQKQRHEIRRKRRRIESSGEVSFLRVESAGKIEGFIALHKNSPEKADFMNSRRERFFREIAGLFSKEGWLELFFLTLDEREIASLLCFSLRDTLYLYNSGYDLEYSSLSPGIVILSLAIEEAIRRGFKQFNLLKGSEKYKYDFGAQDLELYEVCIE
jgi:CelD/BcsL family acetyltransferase involved in cellulose biosynthesis